MAISPAQFILETIYQGDDWILPLAVVDANNIPVSLAGQKVGLTVKFFKDDDDRSAVYKKDLAGDSTGIVVFTAPGFNGANLSNSWGPQTFPASTLWFDIKKWDTSGIRETLATGRLVVSPSTTARQTPVV